MDAENYLELRLDDFLARIAGGEELPGGGSASAVTVALAAGLVAKVARCSSDSWADAAGVSAQALTIAGRAAPLARLDAHVWQEAVNALRLAEDGGADRGDFDLEQKLERAAEVPLEIAQLAADAAALAAVAAEQGSAAYRADAAGAAALAAGAAQAAAHLVEINLGVLEGDARLLQARACERAAAAAAQQVLELRS